MSNIKILDLNSNTLNPINEQEIGKIVGGRRRGGGDRNYTKISVWNTQVNEAYVFGKKNDVYQTNYADIDIDVDN